MENVDKKNIGLPSRYINALYELCDEAKNLKKIAQDFEKFIKLVEDNKNLNNLQVCKKLIYCFSEQNPITRSTPALLYQLRSKITISPAAGK